MCLIGCSVNGNVRVKEVKFEVSNWPDCVFEDGYELKSLSKIDEFVRVNKHLPSAKQIETVGLSWRDE